MKTFFIKIWIYEVHNKLPSMPNVWEQTKINFLRISVADITKEINFRKIINWELQILPQTYHKNKQQHQFKVVCASKCYKNITMLIFSLISRKEFCGSKLNNCCVWLTTSILKASCFKIRENLTWHIWPQNDEEFSKD